jgi:iron complex outermembrane receptor protein
MPLRFHKISITNEQPLLRLSVITSLLILNLTGIDVSLAADKTIPAKQPTSKTKQQPSANQSSDENNTQVAEKKDSATGLEEMVVSATKTETLISNAPAAVTVITEKDMEARNISRLGDALSRVPSLYLGYPALGQTHGTSGSGGFSLRGVDARRTLVLIDGQPLQDGSFNSVDWRTVMTDDIDRVEVVPGAFSSLYGSSAVGGVINVLTKHPDKHELTIRGKKGFQEVNGEDASIYWRENFSNGLGIVAGFGYQNRDGYQNEFNIRPISAGAAGTRVTGAIPTTTRQGDPAYIVGEKGQEPWTQMNATAKLDYKPTDYDHLFAGWSFSNFDVSYTPLTTYLTNAAGLPVVAGTLGVDGKRIVVSENQFVTSAPLNAGSNRFFGGYEHNFTDEVALKANFAYIKREASNTVVGTTSNQWNGAGDLSSSPNTGMDADVHLNFPVHLNFLPFAKEHFFVTGASFHRDYADRTNYSLSNWRDPNSKTGRKNGFTGNSTIYSLYAQDEITIIEPLTVYIGGRFNWWETQGTYFQTTVPVTNSTFNQRGETNFSPKISAVYRPIDELTLRASYGQSFRAPATGDLYSNSVSSNSASPTGYLTTNGDPSMSPENGTSWEVGTEWRITPQYTTGVTYYETQLTDMIYSKNVNLSLTQRVNAGKAQINGVELSFGAKPLDWLELYANYSYIDTKMLSNSADPTSVGKHLTSVPKHIVKGGIIANYQNYSGTLEVNHFSHQFVQSDNSDWTNGVPGSSSAYSVVNAKLGYRINDMIKLNASINNLTNEKYYQFYLMPGINLTTDIRAIALKNP